MDYIIASVETPAAFFDTTAAQTVDVEAEFTDNEWVSLNLCEVRCFALRACQHSCSELNTS